MFKKGQVVAIKSKDYLLDLTIVAQYQRIDRIMPPVPGTLGTTRYYLSEDAHENDPRLFYSEDQLRPLTKQEIEGV